MLDCKCGFISVQVNYWTPPCDWQCGLHLFIYLFYQQYFYQQGILIKQRLLKACASVTGSLREVLLSNSITPLQHNCRVSLGLSFVQDSLWVWKRRCGIRLRAKQAGIVYVDCLHVSWWMSNTTLQRGSPAHGLSAPRKLWDGVLGHDVTLGTWQSAPTRLYKVTLTKWYRWYFEMTAFNFFLGMVFLYIYFHCFSIAFLLLVMLSHV